MTILMFILIVIFSITIHEVGHYIASKVFGIKVRRFCIGLGLKLFDFKKWGTQFEFRLIPLGGMIESDTREIYRIGILKEWIIDLSGVFMNFICIIMGLSILSNENILFNTKIFSDKILKPVLSMMLKAHNYSESSVDIYNAVIFTNRNISISDFWLLFCVINILLLTFNLLPMPLLDGGQLIMCIIRRLSNRFQNTKKYIDKITNIVYLICWTVLLLPLIVEITNINKKPLVTLCYIIIGILICILINFISKTKLLNKYK